MDEKKELADPSTDAIRRIVVATGNPHKVDGIRAALHVPGWDFVALNRLGDFPEPLEDGETFEDNARIKARAAARETGLAALADDSGLEVDALGGRPGVYSARYAGEAATDTENNEKLLEELTGVPSECRTARFVSVLVFIDEQGSELVARGTCEGVIRTSPAGEGGFGYDPLFSPHARGGVQTMAQLSMAEKNALSHRGHALRVLAAKLGLTLGSAGNADTVGDAMTRGNTAEDGLLTTHGVRLRRCGDGE